MHSLLTLLNSEWPKLYRVLAILSAIGLKHVAVLKLGETITKMSSILTLIWHFASQNCQSQTWIYKKKFNTKKSIILSEKKMSTFALKTLLILAQCEKQQNSDKVRTTLWQTKSLKSYRNMALKCNENLFQWKATLLRGVWKERSCTTCILREGTCNILVSNSKTLQYM